MYNLKVGMAAVEMLNVFPLIFPEVTKFCFIIYEPYAGVASRINEPKRKEPTQERADFGKKKWDFEKKLIDKVYNQEDIKGIIDNLVKHKGNELSSVVVVDASDVSNWLNTTIKDLPQNKAIGLLSTVQAISNEVLHIPMMDFSCPVQKSNELFIKEFLKNIDIQNAAIIDSGKSYHLYGLKLFDTNEWITFMAKCLLISPYCDIRFVAHRLLNNHCILRLTASRLKPNIPTVINIFDS